MRLAGLLLALGAQVTPASCGGTETVAVNAVEIDQERAWKHLEAMVAIGPRPAGSQGAEATRAYIESELAKSGLRSERESFVPETPLGPVPMANVVTTIPASAHPTMIGTTSLGR